MQNKLEICGKAQRESTRRREIGENLWVWNSPVAKSRGPHSNALAYAERALST